MKFAVFYVLFLSTMVYAQAPKAMPTPTATATPAAAKPDQPTELENAKLQLAIKDFNLISQQIHSNEVEHQLLASGQQAARQAYFDMLASVKKAHGWGEDVTYNPDSGQWTIPEKKAK